MLKKTLLVLAWISLLFTFWPAYAAEAPAQRLGTGVATAIAVAPNGRVVAVGASIGVWFFTADLQTTLGFWDTGEWVERVQYSADGRYLRANDLFWDTSLARAVPIVPAETVWLEHRCAPNGRYCLKRQVAHFIVTDQDTLIDVALVQTGTLHDAVWAADGQTVYTVGDGGVQVWALPAGQRINQLTSFFTGAVGRVGWSADGQVVGNGSAAWSVSTSQPVAPPQRCPRGSYFKSSLTCTPIRLDNENYDVLIFTRADLSTWRWIEPHTSWTNFADLSADGTLLITSGYDQGQDPCWGGLYWCTPSYPCDPRATTRIWDTASFDFLRQLPVAFCQAVFLPDNTRLIARTSQALELWDWRTGERLWSSSTRSSDLALSPNFEYAATSDGTTASVWRVATGEQVADLNGHTAPTLRGWQRLPGYDVRWPFGVGEITGLAFSPDGTQLAASSGDGTILIWPVP